MQFFMFPKAVQWAKVVSLPGQFWPRGLMFDTPDLESCKLKNLNLI